MAAVLTYRYKRVRKDGKSRHQLVKGKQILRTPGEKGGFKAVQYSYRIQGKKPNVGGNATDK